MEAVSIPVPTSGVDERVAQGLQSAKTLLLNNAETYSYLLGIPNELFIYVITHVLLGALAVFLHVTYSRGPANPFGGREERSTFWTLFLCGPLGMLSALVAALDYFLEKRDLRIKWGPLVLKKRKVVEQTIEDRSSSTGFPIFIPQITKR